MIKVEHTNKTGANDSFKSEHIHIEKLYFALNRFKTKKYEDLNFYNRIELKVDSITEQEYLPIKHCYINTRQTFESICDFGKLIISNTDEQIILQCAIDNISNVNRLGLKEEISKYNSLVVRWCKLNFYPYTDFDKSDTVLTFINDCLVCYAIYDVHKWLIKISNNIEAIVEKPHRSKELINLSKALQFINLTDIVHTNNLNEEILNLPKHYSQIDDYTTITTAGFDKKSKPNKEYILNYCDTIRRNLIGYVMSIINSRPADFTITKQQPFYEPNSKQYRTIETANSVMGIAYYKLLFSLTTGKGAFNRVICKNPNCNNELVKIGRIEWCKTVECQKARNCAKNKTRDNKIRASRK